MTDVNILAMYSVQYGLRNLRFYEHLSQEWRNLFQFCSYRDSRSKLFELEGNIFFSDFVFSHYIKNK